MTLMFQRLARNFIKEGYFPTDGETTERILQALAPDLKGTMKIIDPCAGEGVALAECKQYLGSDQVESFAVEYHKQRAEQAKTLIDRCIQGDFQDTIITPRSFGLVWLNPPYGDLVSDKAQTGDQTKSGRQRLEKLFFQRSLRLLQYGGVLVLIIPHYTLDAEFRRWLAAGFERVSVFLAPEQRFKQAVIIGVRKKPRSADATSQPVKEALEQFIQADIKPELPEQWPEKRYTIPAAGEQEIRFNTLHVDAPQLAEQSITYPCLWDQFPLHFSKVGSSHPRPLMDLSDWHLALALSAGQVSGIVHSNDGKKTYVIKGDTFKDKKNTVQIEEGEGHSREIRTSLDVFVPVIKALDFTTGSPTYGQVLTIK